MVMRLSVGLVLVAPVIQARVHDCRDKGIAGVVGPLDVADDRRPALAVFMRHKALDSVSDEVRHVHSRTCRFRREPDCKFGLTHGGILREVALRRYGELDHLAKQHHCTSGLSAAASSIPSIFARAVKS